MYRHNRPGCIQLRCLSKKAVITALPPGVELTQPHSADFFCLLLSQFETRLSSLLSSSELMTEKGDWLAPFLLLIPKDRNFIKADSFSAQIWGLKIHDQFASSVWSVMRVRAFLVLSCYSRWPHGGVKSRW